MLAGLIAFTIFVSVTSLVWALVSRSPSLFEARMETFRRQVSNTLEGAGDLSLPFSRRILKPTVNGLA
ncbi:MAG TPA: hypothetical protein VJ256_01060, partial [Dehalococcoidia bacterium]|nr:hypothetical protein [Dehalococcoidia bacterium]